MGAEAALRDWRRPAARAVLAAEHAAEEELMRRLAREWREHPSMARAPAAVASWGEDYSPVYPRKRGSASALPSQVKR